MEYKYYTKISKDVSNSGNFVGEPPQMAAQPPPAVAKFISEPLFYFPLYLFYLLYFVLLNYLYLVFISNIILLLFMLIIFIVC